MGVAEPPATTEANTFHHHAVTTLKEPDHQTYNVPLFDHFLPDQELQIGCQHFHHSPRYSFE